MRSYHRTVSIFFVLVLFVPLVQMHFRLTEEVSLIGAVETAEAPDRTLSGWHTGAWQHTAEAYFEQEFGFRSHFVKTDNQINYEIFREISATTRSPIVLGKQNYLFEKNYIDNLNNRDDVPDTVLTEQVDQYATLRDALSERGITVLLLIAPTKPSILRHLVPDRYILPHRRDQKTNYERLVPLLEARGVPYIDGHEFFAELQRVNYHTLFATGGTHWGYVPLCELNRFLIGVLEEESGRDLVDVTCLPITVERALHSANRDLLDLVNLWDDSDFITPTPYPKVGNTADGSEWKPNILFVGDSFLWTLTAMLRDQGVYEDQQMYYYFNTAITYPGEHSEEIDRYAWDWAGRVMNQDIIIIEASETAVNDIGFGFMDLFLEYLDREKIEK